MPGDPRSHGGDGLGPLYNETSCLGCHNLGSPGGAGPVGKNVEIVTLIRGRLPGDVKLDDYHPGFKKSPSVLLHRYGTDPEYRLWRLSAVAGVEFADMAELGGATEREQIREIMGLRPAPRDGAFIRFNRNTRGAGRVKGETLLSSVATLTRRNPPALFGAGLIDSVPVEVLRAAASSPDPRFPETRGRLNSLKDGQVGRFGWKAQTASLQEFVESACAMELGLEVPNHHQARPPLDFTESKKGLDLTQQECDSLTAYVAGLSAPVDLPEARGGDRPDLRAGARAVHQRRLRGLPSTHTRVGRGDLQRFVIA